TLCHLLLIFPHGEQTGRVVEWPARLPAVRVPSLVISPSVCLAASDASTSSSSSISHFSFFFLFVSLMALTADAPTPQLAPI
uniref:Uncharacterized protein n=1 Tax=Caenorhabditis japonica TaxID=281687 RepID=A0A8R1EGU4_CAEJA